MEDLKKQKKHTNKAKKKTLAYKNLMPVAGWNYKRLTMARLLDLEGE